MKNHITAILVAFHMSGVIAFAHCDTLNGPVVADAKAAIARGDVAPVLKWVKEDREGEIRAAFSKTVAVRKQSNEAAELADMYFFETLVRIHREGEGAPYTGLKAAEEVDLGIEMADKTIEDGRIDELAADLSRRLADGIKSRYLRVIAARKHMNDSVEAGREYVEAYVDYIHFCERLFAEAKGKVSGHEEHKH